MSKYYPLLFTPVFKDYIWGGRKLAELGKDLPKKGCIAESWEIAAHKDGMTLVKNGTHAGKTLTDLLAEMGVNLVGSRNRWALKRNKFPLLVKIIDANQRLSLQVHPNDSYATLNEDSELGKSEMWVVLDAEPETSIIYGLSKPTTRSELKDAISEGRLEEYINTIKIHPGDHICVPPGTLHAILEGSLIVEIQQNSNTTYRMYDWNRLDRQGNARALDVEKALDVLNYDQVNLTLKATTDISEKPDYMSELLCQNDYFSTERIRIRSGEEISGNCDGKTFEIWGVLQGEIKLDQIRIKRVNFSLLPAALGVYKIRALKDSILLRSYIV